MDSEERDPVVYGDGVTEFTENFSETAEILFSAGSVPDTLARVVELAVAEPDARRTPRSLLNSRTENR